MNLQSRLRYDVSMSAQEIRIGDAVGARVVLTIGTRIDADFLTGHARVESGGLSGAKEGYFLEWSLRRLRDDLAGLYETLTGTVEFKSDYEEWLVMKVTGNGRGGIEVWGELRPDPAIPQRLIFGFEIDQTYLPPVIASLDGVLPRRGRRRKPKK